MKTPEACVSRARRWPSWIAGRISTVPFTGTCPASANGDPPSRRGGGGVGRRGDACIAPVEDHPQPPISGYNRLQIIPTQSILHRNSGTNPYYLRAYHRLTGGHSCA